MSCPNDLALETFLVAAPHSREMNGHLASCADCRRRVERMRAEELEFRRDVFPRTVDAVLEAGAKRGFNVVQLFKWAPVPVLAAAAAALFVVVRPDAPAPDYVGIKGAGRLSLAVFAAAPQGALQVNDGEAVSAGAALRFQVNPTSPCHLWLVSMDAAGAVSRLFPAEGEGGAKLAGPGALPGGVRLDGAAGPERIFAVCSPEPLAFGHVERAVRAAASGGGADAVRHAARLHGLPRSAAQASVLLEKTP